MRRDECGAYLFYVGAGPHQRHQPLHPAGRQHAGHRTQPPHVAGGQVLRERRAGTLSLALETEEGRVYASDAP